MKISIKTLKGEQFQVEAETSDTVGVLKQKISEAKADHAAERQKLILSGKVLKDATTLAETGIKETDFLVCMITKEVAAKVPKPAPTPTAPVIPAAPVVAPTPAAAPVAAPTPVPAPLNPEAIASLTTMGFPEDECKAALTAAKGNADLAVEYLMTGIPAQATVPAMPSPSATPAAGTPATPAAAGSGVGLELLRSHPQFNQLKQLVQSNPASMNQVLESIGNQNPQLLAAIHANHDAFVAMMNEPIDTATPPPAPAAAGAPAMPGFPGGIPGGMPGGPGGMNPAQLVQMLNALPPAQRDQMAQSMGMSGEQLQGMMQMISSLPPAQLQQMLGGMGGAGGMPGAAGGMPGAAGGDGAEIVRLSEEEMAAVNRLMELGFSPQQAAQAFLACDKNEGLAANLLLEGWGNDEGGF